MNILFEKIDIHRGKITDVKIYFYLLKKNLIVVMFLMSHWTESLNFPKPSLKSFSDVRTCNHVFDSRLFTLSPREIPTLNVTVHLV